MKKILFTFIAMFAMTIQVYAMSYEQAREEALFLTDKMAYELNLTDAQYEAAYEINLDYLMSVTNRNNVFGPCWDHRNIDIRYVLYSWQWDAFCAATYFYRPLYWEAGCWHFCIYTRYPHRRHFYFGRPHFYASYCGAHSWRMNGGCSYYERHCANYRSQVSHGCHVGMRDGWNRGSYRSNLRGNSSTRITGDNVKQFNARQETKADRRAEKSVVKSLRKVGDLSSSSRASAIGVSRHRIERFSDQSAINARSSKAFTGRTANYSNPRSTGISLRESHSTPVSSVSARSSRVSSSSSSSYRSGSRHPSQSDSSREASGSIRRR